jgi:diguanylate cyclase (GGDEF)-like protein
MKNLISAFAILLVCGPAAWAAELAPLTSLRAIHALSNVDASHRLPVAFEATVTYYRGYENNLFVQDGDTGIYVGAPTDANLVPGDRVLVRGKTQESFNPFIVSESITLLRHGDPVKPKPASFDQMIRAETDCKLVIVRGVVRSADFMPGVHYANLQMLTDGGYFAATVDGDGASALEGLLDAEVELTGVASETFDSKMQVTGILIHIQTAAGIKVLNRASASPWSLPVTSMDQVLAVYHVSDSTPRVRVHGTITYYEPGAAVILQDGVRSIWIETQTRNLLQVGDVADATGFPDAHGGFLNLVHGEIRDTLTRAPVTPTPATWETLTPRGNAVPGHHDDLVSIEGQVVTQVRESSQDEYVLSTDGKLFSAIYRHLDGPPQSSKQIPIGSRVQVIGICVLEVSNPFSGQVPFNILMRSPDDIAVVAHPSLLNVRNLVIALGLMVLIVLVVGARGWYIERRVRRQTTAMAYIERRRSRILEDINGSRPLAEIIDQITELVSFKLKGAPCWCQIAGGARLGNCPKDLSRMRVVSQEIPARSAPPLGEVFAAFDPLTKPHDIEAESLASAVGLAALAIETRRLYSDLIRRSEFDLLTDIHNRFSLDKRLDAQIEEAYRDGGIFGIIYIDLDNFKKVNDELGHRIGDLYLQEMAIRMKRQLRSVDTLARLGGDEFAILVPLIRSRAHVSEVALRLERCFDEPLHIEGVTLHPAASVGVALYPEDATTKDGLLSAADDSMYKTKNAKRRLARTLGVGEILESELRVRS